MCKRFICVGLNIYCRQEFSNNTFTTFTSAHHWCLVYHATGKKIKISKRLKWLLSMINALIFKDILTYCSVSWSKDTSFSLMFIYNYMFIMQRNTDWRFSEAIHLLKCVGFIAKLFFFLVYISSLYTKTVFKQDLPGFVTNLQTVKSTLNKRNLK